MIKTAFVFPGQGSQYVGMGKEITANFTIAKRVYEEASDYLNLDMAKLCFQGPNQELIKTENTQPAILSTSIAILRVLEEIGFDCGITAGLSLGEYSSLVKSDVIQFHDAVSLVKKRGKYMQEAVPLGIGGMAAIMGLDRGKVEEGLNACQEYGVVEVANYNSPGQIVISGEIEAVKTAINKLNELGAKKAVLLPVSAPFHCSLLRPAGDKLREDLEGIRINSPKISLVTNVEAKVLESKEEVIPTLVKQVSSSVLWQGSIEKMINLDVDTFIEIGPGKTLTSFVKRIAKNMDRDVKTYNVEDLKTLKILESNR